MYVNAITEFSIFCKKIPELAEILMYVIFWLNI